ncbi:molybdopterin-dependent oxidoreductase [Nitratireductor sp. XY-223]|uniref:molybdopterin-dependent oxidoreductase n=1 Tax=Nitratireductor sp. XY-223 TaxID=2561926 RepID=UPI0010AAA5D7|nr:molybdopterin-dependent oxidoreductase [Nitratireductor sp. XY-223]
MRYTAAHWGTYRAVGEGETLRLEGIEQDPAPSRIADGWIDAVRDAGLRVKKPAIRRGWLENRSTSDRCNDSYVETDWDTALDLVAAELDRIRMTHGNEAIFAGSYGWSSAGRFHHAQSQLRRFLNTIGGFTYSRNTYSHAAAEVLLPYIVGMPQRAFQDNMTSLALVAEHCELLVAFGGISANTAQVTSSGTSTHEVEYWMDRAGKNGMAAVNISPRRPDFCGTGPTEWLPIRPNTDTALMLGLAHELYRNNRHDRAFLTRYCHGWETFESYLTGASDGIEKTAEWASGICDIEAETIAGLAARMAQSKTMVSVAWSLQRGDHGEQPIWMGLTLAAMLGQIGRPGTGFGFGYASTTPVGRPKKLMNWPSFPQGQNPVSQAIPVARISDMLLHPAAEYRYDGEHQTYPDIRLVYWVGGNPFHHHQDLYRLEKAWTRPETVIVNEQWWTATARRADIVLPATSPLERTDIMMNRRDPCLVWMDKLVEPLGEARDDHDIFRALAERLGTLAEFSQGKSKDDWIRQLWQEAGDVARQNGFELPDFDAFRETGIFECPDTDEDRIQLESFIKDPAGAPLQTESGKIEIVSDRIGSFGLPDCPAHPQWIEPVEWLGHSAAAKDDLHLISGQPATRLHGQLDNGSFSRSKKVRGCEALYIHPEAAKARGIADSDLVCLFNARGRCLAGAVLTDGIRPDTVALAAGAWFDPQTIDGEPVEVSGNPNVLTIDKGCSELSQGNIAHTSLVKVMRWDGPKPPAGGVPRKR